ncbi:hypothetical protein ACOCJ4_02550 [Knoellia sp. CPCC 206435]|uniref:hypothetical protein n=1 Tax=Knoellia terrae TaxID=3404797 RepID=UPI003B436477
MTLQSDFEEAGRIYAQRLTEQAETERLAALRVGARRENNAAAFAAAITEHDTDETEPNA